MNTRPSQKQVEKHSGYVALHQLLSDINNRRSQPDSSATDAIGVAIYAGNQGAIKHANTEGITARTKHFDIYLKHARDLQQKGIVQFTYIKSMENTVDVLTKGLPLPSHCQHVKNLELGDLGQMSGDRDPGMVAS